jgi:hypothetical protein
MDERVTFDIDCFIFLEASIQVVTTANILVFACLLEKGERKVRREWERIGNANLPYTSKQRRQEHNKRGRGDRGDILSSHTIWVRREARLRKYQGLKKGKEEG